MEKEQITLYDEFGVSAIIDIHPTIKIIPSRTHEEDDVRQKLDGEIFSFTHIKLPDMEDKNLSQHVD